MKIILGLTLVALFAIPSEAHATDESTLDGNYLLRSCAISVRQMNDPNHNLTVDDAWHDGVCSGLVAGVMFASPTVCNETGVTVGQGIRVVDKYLQDHPERLNLRDARLVNEALSQAFPCKH